MKLAVIIKFVLKLVLLEAFLTLLFDFIYLAASNHVPQMNLLLPIGTLLALVMASPIAMSIYLLLRIDYGYNNKNLLHAVHALIFIVAAFVFASGPMNNESKVLFLIPCSAVVIASTVVIYRKSPKAEIS